VFAAADTLHLAVSIRSIVPRCARDVLAVNVSEIRLQDWSAPFKIAKSIQELDYVPAYVACIMNDSGGRERSVLLRLSSVDAWESSLAL
jgi:hypothetical protein